MTSTETSTAYTTADIAGELQNAMYDSGKTEITFTGRDGDQALKVTVSNGRINIDGFPKDLYGARAAAPVVARLLRGPGN